MKIREAGIEDIPQIQVVRNAVTEIPCLILIWSQIKIAKNFYFPEERAGSVKAAARL